MLNLRMKLPSKDDGSNQISHNVSSAQKYIKPHVTEYANDNTLRIYTTDCKPLLTYMRNARSWT